MGYMKHDTIIVTHWSDDVVTAREKAVEVFESKQEGYSRIISPLVGSVINTQQSFFIAPDGSKEGWSDSDLCNEARKEFLDWLNNNSDNNSDYIMVNFGGDDEMEGITRSKHKDFEDELHKPF